MASDLPDNYEEVRVRGIKEPVAFIVDKLDICVNTALSREELERVIEVLIEDNRELLRYAKEAERVYNYMHEQLLKNQEQSKNHGEESEQA